MERGDLETWIDRYVRAWRTAGTAPLAELFAPAATYRTAPFEEPFRGLGAIASMWELERTGPDERFALHREIVAVEGDTGVARVEVRYGESRPRTFRDLWIVQLDADGRCTAFEEWPFSPGGPGPYAAGPDRA